MPGKRISACSLMIRQTLFLTLALGAMSALPWREAIAAAPTMYPDDPDRAAKEAIEEIFGVYILNPSRRHPLEQVVLKDNAAELWLFYDQRRPDIDKVKCAAYKWLLLGRFSTSPGAKKFFDAYPDLNEVTLIFFTLTSKRTVDAKGQYTVEKNPERYLAVTLSRNKAAKLDFAALKTSMQVEGKTCAEAGEKSVDKKWYGSYLGKR